MEGVGRTCGTEYLKARPVAPRLARCGLAAVSMQVSKHLFCARTAIKPCSLCRMSILEASPKKADDGRKVGSVEDLQPPGGTLPPRLTSWACVMHRRGDAVQVCCSKWVSKLVTCQTFVKSLTRVPSANYHKSAPGSSRLTSRYEMSLPPQRADSTRRASPVYLIELHYVRVALAPCPDRPPVPSSDVHSPTGSLIPMVSSEVTVRYHLCGQAAQASLLNINTIKRINLRQSRNYR